MLLIPAIDLKDGHCVRLKQGDMDQSTTFGEDPAAMARKWVDAGARRLHLVDLQYSDVRLDKGLYNRLVARGSMKRLVDEADVTRAITCAPENTRAYFRGECLRRFGGEVAAASWDSVIFDLGGESLVRIPTLEPLRGSRAHVGALLDSVDSAAELVGQLTN